jgi:hypothetical protein
VARRIVAGARQEPREVFMSAGMRVAAALLTLFPRPIEQALRRRAP